VRRSVLFAAAVLLLGACGDEQSPAIDAEGLENQPTTAVPAATSTTLPPVDAEPQSATLALAGEGGEATLQLDYDGSALCSTVSGDVGALTGAHVHAGTVDAGGPVVIDLQLVAYDAEPVCVTIGAEGGIIFADPASYYADVHTADLPDGAAAAQLG
jgi:hypothetical protein